MVCLKIIWKILQLMVLHGDLEFSDIVALTITVTVQFFSLATIIVYSFPLPSPPLHLTFCSHFQLESKRTT